MNTLASRFPGFGSSVPLISLTSLPTPLDSAPALASALDLGDLLIKRDDISGQVYGGNKVRKLEYLLADALDRGADSVVTFGAAGSNHVLATAVYAREMGLGCYAVLIDQAVTPYVATTLRYHAWLGTELVYADSFKNSARAAERIIARHPGGPDRVYSIPWGGSSWLGATAFVNAALELDDQLNDRTVPEKAYVACGSMGTVIGLALGFRVADLRTRIVAVQVVPGPVTASRNFEKLFETTNRELHERDKSFPMFDDPLRNVDIRWEFLGPGYAITTPECTEAVRLMDETEGLKLETTYTGKALAALIHDTRSGALAGSTVLYWNTHSSRPYPADLDAISPDAFPAPFRKYFDNH